MSEENKDYYYKIIRGLLSKPDEEQRIDDVLYLLLDLLDDL